MLRTRSCRLPQADDNTPACPSRADGVCSNQEIVTSSRPDRRAPTPERSSVRADIRRANAPPWEGGRSRSRWYPSAHGAASSCRNRANGSTRVGVSGAIVCSGRAGSRRTPELSGSSSDAPTVAGFGSTQIGGKVLQSSCRAFCGSCTMSTRDGGGKVRSWSRRSS
jgi:hypothetical protein